MITIKLVGLVNGPPTADDGQYLVEYDPRPRRDHAGEFIHLVTTPDRAKAARFGTLREALEVYRASSGRVRRDGSMDCPLTAYSAEFENWDLADAFDQAAAACNRLADALEGGGL